MMKTKQKITLDRPETYHIKVPGVLDKSWGDWVEDMLITTESEDDSRPVTTLVSTMDQAGLQGLLRRLYSLGLPLISVKCVDND